MSDAPIQTSAVIPAFNEASRIAKTLQELRPHVDEIIVVDDGSRDQTAKIARELGACVVQQPRNQGYIQAIKAGIAVAKGEIIITIDADGEFNPTDIAALVAPIHAGVADMVQGQRQTPPRPSERFLTWLATQKTTVGDSGTGLRAMRSSLAKSLRIPGACICGLLSLEAASKGAKIVDVPIHLRTNTKPRRIAWFHLRQVFYLLPWLIRSYKGR